VVGVLFSVLSLHSVFNARRDIVFTFFTDLISLTLVRTGPQLNDTHIHTHINTGLF